MEIYGEGEVVIYRAGLIFLICLNFYLNDNLKLKLSLQLDCWKEYLSRM